MVVMNVEDYWRWRLGVGESIIAVNDFIECWISRPNLKDGPSYKPMKETQAFLKQYDYPRLDDESLIEFPARKLKKVRKIIDRIRREKQNCQKYEIATGVYFTVKPNKHYVLENGVNCIQINDFDDFIDIINDLFLVFEEQCKLFS